MVKRISQFLLIIFLVVLTGCYLNDGPPDELLQAPSGVRRTQASVTATPSESEEEGDGETTEEADEGEESEDETEGSAEEGPVDDQDGDGILDESDNCPEVANASQQDTNRDREGNACDLDDDADGVNDEEEVTHGSLPLDSWSLPENLAYDEATCADAIDNDLDGYVDAGDDGCHVEAEEGEIQISFTAPASAAPGQIIPLSWDVRGAQRIAFGSTGISLPAGLVGSTCPYLRCYGTREFEITTLGTYTYSLNAIGTQGTVQTASVTIVISNENYSVRFSPLVSLPDGTTINNVAIRENVIFTATDHGLYRQNISGGSLENLNDRLTGIGEGEEIKSVATNGSVVLAVSAAGELFESDNGGNSWSRSLIFQPGGTATPETTYSVASRGSNYIIGSNHGIYRGATSSATAAQLVGLTGAWEDLQTFATSSSFFALSDQGRIYKSTSGSSWRATNRPSGTAQFIEEAGSQTYLITSAGAYYLSGNSWYPYQIVNAGGPVKVIGQAEGIHRQAVAGESTLVQASQGDDWIAATLVTDSASIPQIKGSQVIGGVSFVWDSSKVYRWEVWEEAP